MKVLYKQDRLRIYTLVCPETEAECTALDIGRSELAYPKKKYVWYFISMGKLYHNSFGPDKTPGRIVSGYRVNSGVYTTTHDPVDFKWTHPITGIERNARIHHKGSIVNGKPLSMTRIMFYDDDGTPLKSFPLTARMTTPI